MKSFGRSSLGALGEVTASHYLKTLGYKILSRNFRTRYGEIDIVAMDGDTLVFVEVKTRKSFNFGTAKETITPKKLERLVQAASYYRLQRPDLTNPMRIDLVAIHVSSVNTIEQIALYKNISD